MSKASRRSKAARSKAARRASLGGSGRRKPLARNPKPASVRAVPELDPSRPARKNPFVSSLARHGAKVVEVPSEDSLREMPEVDLDRVRVQKNPYAERLSAARAIVLRVGDREVRLAVGKGRPRTQDAPGSSTPRSVRLPDEVWRALDERAAERGLSRHAAIREAIAAWLNDDD